MTFFQKVFILLYFLQGEISCGMFNINPFNFISPMNIVMNMVKRVPGVESGMKFHELVADPKTRSSFLIGHLVSNLVPLTAAGYIGHRCLQGMSSDYANSGIAKGMLFGAVGLLAIRESLHSYEEKKKSEQLQNIQEKTGQILTRVEQNGNGILTANGKLDALQADVTNARAQLDLLAAKAHETATAVDQVAGDVQILKRRQGFLCLGIFSLRTIFKHHGVLLGNIQAQMGADRADHECRHSETTTTLRSLGGAQDHLSQQLDALREDQAGHNESAKATMGKILQAVSPSTIPIAQQSLSPTASAANLQAPAPCGKPPSTGSNGMNDVD